MQSTFKSRPSTIKQAVPSLLQLASLNVDSTPPPTSACELPNSSGNVSESPCVHLWRYQVEVLSNSIAPLRIHGVRPNHVYKPPRRQLSQIFANGMNVTLGSNTDLLQLRKRTLEDSTMTMGDRRFTVDDIDEERKLVRGMSSASAAASPAMVALVTSSTDSDLPSVPPTPSVASPTVRYSSIPLSATACISPINGTNSGTGTPPSRSLVNIQIGSPPPLSPNFTPIQFPNSTTAFEAVRPAPPSRAPSTWQLDDNTSAINAAATNTATSRTPLSFTLGDDSTLFLYLFGESAYRRFSIRFVHTLRLISAFFLLLATATVFLVLTGMWPVVLSYLCLPYIFIEFLSTFLFMHWKILKLLLTQFQVYFLILQLIGLIIGGLAVLDYNDPRILFLCAWVLGIVVQMLTDARPLPIMQAQFLNFIAVFVVMPVVIGTYANVFQFNNVEFTITNGNVINALDFLLDRILIISVFWIRIFFYRWRFPGCFVMIQAKLTSPFADQWKIGEDINKWTNERILWRNCIMVSPTNVSLMKEWSPLRLMNVRPRTTQTRNSNDISTPPLLHMNSATQLQLQSQAVSPLMETRSMTRSTVSSPPNRPIPLQLQTNAGVVSVYTPSNNEKEATSSNNPNFSPMVVSTANTASMLALPSPLSTPRNESGGWLSLHAQTVMSVLQTGVGEHIPLFDVTDQSTVFYRLFGSENYLKYGVPILRLYLNLAVITLLTAAAITFCVIVGFLPAWASYLCLPWMILEFLQWIFFTHPVLLIVLLRQFEFLFLLANALGTLWALYELFAGDARFICAVFFFQTILTSFLYDARCIPNKTAVVLFGFGAVCSVLVVALVWTNFDNLEDITVTYWGGKVIHLRAFFADRCLTIALFFTKNAVNRILHPGCFLFLQAAVLSPFRDRWKVGESLQSENTNAFNCNNFQTNTAPNSPNNLQRQDSSTVLKTTVVTRSTALSGSGAAPLNKSPLTSIFVQSRTHL